VQGPSHLMISWFFAEASGVEEARDRRIIAWSGLMPDVDVLAYLGAIVYYRFDKELAFENVWKPIHHVYTHNIAFVMATGIVAYALAGKGHGNSGRLKVAILAMVVSALHNFCDLVGGGPTWPIYPMWPLSSLTFHAEWSWTIGEWPNIVILVALLAGTLLYGRAVGHSPVECFGGRADRWMVRILREGSDRPAGSVDAAAAAAARRQRILIWSGVVLATLAILAPLGFNPFR
jgi:inner membrane protein